jgi:hypothetical protein
MSEEWKTLDLYLYNPQTADRRQQNYIFKVEYSGTDKLRFVYSPFQFPVWELNGRKLDTQENAPKYIKNVRRRLRAKKAKLKAKTLQ